MEQHRSDGKGTSAFTIGVLVVLVAVAPPYLQEAITVLDPAGAELRSKLCWICPNGGSGALVVPSGGGPVELTAGTEHSGGHRAWSFVGGGCFVLTG